ncbi:sigma-70 family RNA polymerase sigma factor [Christensenella hongkongensis]|uniref:sigma-70 family RNA polymerase sigma factor n=1 Tax=Christensenella hongkongensis TaxID=270498 RepID=UPI002672ECDD|nr:sigma-70 family RNA polymerase sigma factor [Christensenella hongkongensis]
MTNDDLINLFENNYKYYFVIVFSIAQNITDAEDILQTAFLKAYITDKQKIKNEDMKRWFITVCKNTAITFVIKREKDMVREQQYVLDNVSIKNVEEDSVFTIIVEEQLKDIPQELIPYFKELIFHGTSMRQICKKYGIPRDKMRYWKKYLEKAVKKLY